MYMMNSRSPICRILVHFLVLCVNFYHNLMLAHSSCWPLFHQFKQDLSLCFPSLFYACNGTELSSNQSHEWVQHAKVQRSAVGVMVMCRDTKMSNTTENSRLRALKTKNHHDADFVITGGTGGCHDDNLQCHQGWQSRHHDNFRFLVIGHPTELVASSTHWNLAMTSSDSYVKRESCLGFCSFSLKTKSKKTWNSPTSRCLNKTRSTISRDHF